MSMLISPTPSFLAAILSHSATAATSACFGIVVLPTDNNTFEGILSYYRIDIESKHEGFYTGGNVEVTFFKKIFLIP